MLPRSVLGVLGPDDTARMTTAVTATAPMAVQNHQRSKMGASERGAADIGGVGATDGGAVEGTGAGVAGASDPGAGGSEPGSGSIGDKGAATGGGAVGAGAPVWAATGAAREIATTRAGSAYARIAIIVRINAGAV